MVPTHAKGDVWLTGPKGPVAASACELTSVELLVVQPASMQSDAYADPAQQLLVAESSTSSNECLHRLQMHMQAKIALQTQESKEVILGSCADPNDTSLRLEGTVLELVVLGKHTHVLLSQQYSLLQLLQQQQQDAQVQQSQHSGEKDTHGGVSWTVPFQMYATVACESTEQRIDFINLVILSKSSPATRQQQREGHTRLLSTTADAVNHQQPVRLLAETPVLLLPAVAHQEVQQLLLPAMRQEAQTTLLGTSDSQVEHAVWQHLQPLIYDLCAVVLLARMLANPAAEARAASIAAEAAATARGAASTTEADLQWSSGVEPPPTAPSESEQPSVPEVAQGPSPMSSAAALDSLADVLLFPVLLPFLAAYGLHNLLQLLLACLPAELQQQWEQQQQTRLQAKHGDFSVCSLDASDRSADCGILAVQQGCARGADDTALSRDPQQHSSKTAVAADGSEKQSLLPKQQMYVEQQMQQEHWVGSETSTKPTAAAATATSSAVGAGQHSTGAGAAEGSAVTGVCTAAWYSPLTQFERDAERRYLTWKHHSLIDLDHIGALFAVMYMLALLKRMISEPTTLFYFIYVMLKCLPLVPLILGYRVQFLRNRELWLWLVIPASLLAFLLFSSVQRIADPTALLPRKAISAYWSGRGELVTSSMRPFIQHMRLRPYVVYTLVDAAMVAWVFAQFYGWWAAVGRWGVAAVVSIGLCWGLDLHMRRKFLVVEHRMRA